MTLIFIIKLICVISIITQLFLVYTRQISVFTLNMVAVFGSLTQLLILGLGVWPVFNLLPYWGFDVPCFWMLFLTLVIQGICFHHLSGFENYKKNFFPNSNLNEKDKISFLNEKLELYFTTPNQKKKVTYLVISFIIHSTTFILINFFNATDLFWFFVWFEALLIPLYMYIGLFGVSVRRVESAHYLFVFTFVGSLSLFTAILFICSTYGISDINLISKEIIGGVYRDVLFLFIFFSLAFKIPLIGVHVWLPKAHVEAPTLGSIILAALILKTGTFAIIRLLIPLFQDVLFTFLPICFVICLISMIYPALRAIRETDVKRIVALSSIVHMSFATIGLLLPTSGGTGVGLLMMFGHGFVSAGLFYVVGCIYERYDSRNLNTLCSLWTTDPFFACALLFFILANIGFPGTINFVAEIGILLSIFGHFNYISIFFIFGFVFNTIFNIWLAIRLLYGNYPKESLVKNPEIPTQYEKEVIIILIFFIVFYSFFPSTILYSLTSF
jgi:proton-translocating NADH-quinone oxidoreductase chain M